MRDQCTRCQCLATESCIGLGDDTIYTGCVYYKLASTKQQRERAYMVAHKIKNAEGETPKYAWEIEDNKQFADMMLDLYGIVDSEEDV